MKKNDLKKRVAVLMSTYNGEKYLREQLDSIYIQEDIELDVYVRDDGSTDNTINILKEYQQKQNLKWCSGENIGVGNSFIKLLYDSPEADYYAFSDQDDVWMPQKLISAIDKLNLIQQDTYKLYFSNTILVDAKLNKIGASDYNPRLTLEASLIRNYATGCTMVFNNKLKKAVYYDSISDMPVFHDAWIYSLCLALGGKLVFDQAGHILYRQHENNVIGGNEKFITRWKRRATQLLHPSHSRLKHANMLILLHAHTLNSDILYSLNLLSDNYNNKLKLISNKNFRTNSLKINIMFIFAVLLGVI